MKHTNDKKQHLLAHDEHHHHREQFTPKLALKVMANTFFASMLPNLIAHKDILLRHPPQERSFYSNGGILSMLHKPHRSYQDRRVTYASS